MLERIFVGLDGSEVAEEVLLPAGVLARDLGSTLTLAYIMSCPECGPPVTHGVRDRVRPGDLPGAGRYLGMLRRGLRQQGTKSEVLVCVGHPQEILIGLAEKGADLLALRAGTPGLRGAAATFTSELLQRTRIPLLLYRRLSQPGDLTPGHFRTVIAPLDGSALATGALSWVEGVVKALGSDLLVPMVVPGWPPPLWASDAPRRFPFLGATRVEEEAALHLGGAVVGLLENGVRAEPLLLYGDPGVELAELARRVPDSLMVLSACAECGLGPWFAGTTAHDVVYGSGIPVLLVPSRCDTSLEEEPLIHGGDPWQEPW